MTNSASAHFPAAPVANLGGTRREAEEKDPLRRLRLAVYTYFLLWLFEGALRKWILPGLATPLLIVRDPVLLYIYFEAFRLKIWKLETFATSMIVLGTLATIVSIGLVKPPPMKVTFFGVHSNFLHLPFIFLLPQIISYTEVRKMGRIVLWLAPPMAVLAALQFLSPSGAWINIGAGGEGKMLETAMNRIRPSGLFSFTNGLADYTVLLSAFMFHHLLEKKIFPKLAFLAAAPSLLILVVMSGSRTVFALVALEVLTVFVIWIIKPRFLQSSIKLVAIAAVVVFVIGSVGALRLGMDVIVARFTTSGGMKQGLIIRFLDEFKKPIDAASRAEPAGVGIGMGTNAASSMMYNMLRFNLGESEMDRIVMEMGPYLGMPYLLWRFAALFVIVRLALGALRKESNTLPLLLATACANDLIMGQFGQSTVLGYAVMAAGFSLASLQRRPDEGLTSYEGFEPAAISNDNAGLHPSSGSLQPRLSDGMNAASQSAPRQIPSYADQLRQESELEAAAKKVNLTDSVLPPVPLAMPEQKKKVSRAKRKATAEKAAPEEILPGQ